MATKKTNESSESADDDLIKYNRSTVRFQWFVILTIFIAAIVVSSAYLFTAPTIAAKIALLAIPLVLLFVTMGVMSKIKKYQPSMLARVLSAIVAVSGMAATPALVSLIPGKLVIVPIVGLVTVVCMFAVFVLSWADRKTIESHELFVEDEVEQNNQTNLAHINTDQVVIKIISSKPGINTNNSEGDVNDDDNEVIDDMEQEGITLETGCEPYGKQIAKNGGTIDNNNLQDNNPGTEVKDLKKDPEDEDKIDEKRSEISENDSQYKTPIGLIDDLGFANKYK